MKAYPNEDWIELVPETGLEQAAIRRWKDGWVGVRVLERAGELSLEIKLYPESDIVADTARALDESQDEPDAGDAPTVPFKVGDRLKDWVDDICTVVAVRDDGFDVQYDDRQFGDQGLVQHPAASSRAYTIIPPPCRPYVTPHPDRPPTADGEVPEGWREDCYGNLYAPDGSDVFHEKQCRHWTAFDRKTLGCGGGPKYFARRSEAIARLQELLGEGDGR